VVGVFVKDIDGSAAVHVVAMVVASCVAAGELGVGFGLELAG